MSVEFKQFDFQRSCQELPVWIRVRWRSSISHSDTKTQGWKFQLFLLEGIYESHDKNVINYKI